MSDEFKIELVEPRNPALHTVASVDPFSDNADWEEREKETSESENHESKCVKTTHMK